MELKERWVTVLNDDKETIKIRMCKLSGYVRKESGGPVTHALVYWYDDFMNESTGRTHLVPLDLIVYECADRDGIPTEPIRI